MSMQEVTSPESFHEFLTHVVTVLEARMKGTKEQVPVNLQLFRFLSGMEAYVKMQSELKEPLEPSWQTFAMLVRAGLWNAC